MKLINTRHLVGVFTASLLTEMVDNLLRTYRGKDCIETFCNYIKGEARRLYHMFPELPMGPLTKKQWNKYKRSTKCHICYKPFTLKDPKVRDHCHYTGLYRGPAHSLCNLRYKIPSYIPVVFHKLIWVRCSSIYWGIRWPRI